MFRLNPSMLVIKFLGFFHITIGLFMALHTTLQLRNESSSGFAVFSMVFGYGILSLPLILGGLGLITLKNRARIFLIFYDILILLAISAPGIQICLQGPAFRKYWVDVLFNASIPLLVIIYLLLPSVGRYFH